MSEIASRFCDVGVTTLRHYYEKNPLDFDLYVLTGHDNFIKIFNRGDFIDFTRLEQYQKKGVNFLYVAHPDFIKYATRVEALGETIIKNPENYPVDIQSSIVKELAELTMQQILLDNGLPPQTYINSGNVVNYCLHILDGNSIMPLLKILSQIASSAYQVRHAMSVSVFAVMLAKELQFSSASALENIGVGAFLHDIGISALSFDPESVEEMSPKQEEEFRKHPAIGLEMAQKVKSVRGDILSIILEHHERPDGQGYPKGLSGPSIYIPAKIVTIADKFSGLVTRRKFHPEKTRFEAIEIMRSEAGRRYDKKFLDVFSKIII